MKKTNLDNISTKELLEHLLVGYTHDDLVGILKEIQSEWDKMSVTQWECRVTAKVRGAK